MNTELQMRNIALSIQSTFPEYAASLNRLATIVGRQERTLDEMVADAMADAALPAFDAVVVPFRRRVGR